jgi:hypothetical protein
LGTWTFLFWGGVNGVGPLALPAVPEVPWGPFPVYQCHPVVCSGPILPYSTVPSLCLLLAEVSEDSRSARL